MAKIQFSHFLPFEASRSYELIEDYLRKLKDVYKSKGNDKYELMSFPEEKRLTLKGKNFSASLQVALRKSIAKEKDSQAPPSSQVSEELSLVQIHIELPFFALPFKEKIQKEFLFHLKKALQEEETPQNAFPQESENT